MEKGQDGIGNRATAIGVSTGQDRFRGSFLTPQGNNVQTVYVDLSGEVETKGLCLVKATEPQYDLATASTIRLSLPKVFRHMGGEVLIQDEQEGRARTSTSESIDVPSEEPELVGERVSALNAALQLGRTKMSMSGSEKSKRSNTSASAVTFGRDCLIYCTSMRPSKDEEEAWRRSLPDRYTSFTPIYRPTQFAQGLGVGVCEHLGARGRRRRRGRCSTDSGPWRSGAGSSRFLPVPARLLTPRNSSPVRIRGARQRTA